MRTLPSGQIPLLERQKPFSKEEIEEVAKFLKKNASSDSGDEFSRFKVRWMNALEKVYGQSSVEFQAAKKELVQQTQAQVSALQALFQSLLRWLKLQNHRYRWKERRRMINL